MDEENKKTNKKTNKNKVIIIVMAVVFILCFVVINKSNDGDLNDYEIYKPTITINETINDEDNKTNDFGEFIGGLMVFMIILGMVIILSIVVSSVSSFSGDYC